MQEFEKTIIISDNFKNIRKMFGKILTKFLAKSEEMET